MQGFETDGSPAVYFELNDTAALADGKLRSKGGLPANPSGAVEAPLRQAAPASAPPPMPAGLGFTPAARARSLAAPLHAAALEGAPAPHAAMLGGFETFGLLSAMTIDSGEHYLAGHATLEIEGQVEVKPAAGASIFVAQVGTSPKRGGQFIGTTDERGAYLFASSLCGELIHDGAQVMGIERDFGVTAFTVDQPSGPGGIWGSYFHAPPLEFKVLGADLGDHQAPWAELRIEGANVISDQEARTGTFTATVNAYDSRDKTNLTVSIAMDGQPAKAYRFSAGGSGGKWQADWEGAPGAHALEAIVKDQSGNESRMRRTLHVLDFSAEPPIAAGPPTFEISVDGGIKDAKPDTLIRVAFSEPVSGVEGASLGLFRVDGPSGARIKVDGIRLMGPQGPVSPDQRLGQVFLIPPARLEIGATYEVTGTAAIRDFDAPPSSLGDGKGVTKAFQVTSARSLGSIALNGSPTAMAALGDRAFLAVNGQIQMIRLVNGIVAGEAVTFGLPGTAANDFSGQDIQAMGAFRKVSIGWALRDLLLVATTPRIGDPDHQAVLWAFDACDASQTPTLLFGVSLGQGSTGYSPSLDCRDGIIAVGRLIGSNLLIDATRALKGWTPEAAGMVRSPSGANQQAILQPFYLTDPEQGDFFPLNEGIGLLPKASSQGQDADAILAVVGFLQPGSQWRGLPMTGLASSQHPYQPGGAYLPHPAFKADPSSLLFASPATPPADANALPGPIGNGDAAKRLAVLPRIAVEDAQGAIRTTNLVIAESRYKSSLPEGQGSQSGSWAILEKAGEEQARLIGLWPNQEAPFGAGVAYDMVHHTPSVDELSGLTLVPLRRSADGGYALFVLDLKRPSAPRVVAVQPALSTVAALNQGVLWFKGLDGAFQALRIVDLPAPGGGCSDMPKVAIAMDGMRSGGDINPEDPANHKYLFWVNDDCDYTSWKWWSEDPTSSEIEVDDDEQEGVNLEITGPDGQRRMISASPNCNDDKINGLRDLEDFTRVHMKVDPRIAAIPGVTYWLKFDNITWGNPSMNLFQAEKQTMEYLSDLDIANNQLQKKRVIPVGTTEVQLSSQYLQPNGQVSPFLLEGRSPGKGSLTLIARLGGMEVSRDAVELELREPSEFVEKYKVDAVAPDSDQVQTQAVPENPPCAYTPESDEYVLYVHGWNMAQYEKDRWLETVFKRLWWLGYKGRVGGFRWPTLQGILSYNQSEWRAWRSGQALTGLLENLNGQHPGKVRVIAHSMGNVVTGEALHLSSGPVLHSYIAAQAAIPASLYDNQVPSYGSPYAIPDVYGYYPDGPMAYTAPYLFDNKTKVQQDHLFRYFNQKDFALRQWAVNNVIKPGPPYMYREGDGLVDTYWPGAGDAFLKYDRVSYRTLHFPEDRFEIFAFSAPSRSLPLGSIGAAVNGFQDVDLEAKPFNFDRAHYSHSREFRSNLLKERPFWEQLWKDFGLGSNVNGQ